MEEEKFINSKGEEVKRQPCDVYSRVCGYIVPSNMYNPGKLQEFQDREMFNPNI